MQKIHNLRYYTSTELSALPDRSEAYLAAILAELQEAVESAKKAKGES